MCLSHGQVMSKVYMSELTFYVCGQSDIGFGAPWICGIEREKGKKEKKQEKKRKELPGKKETVNPSLM